MATDRSSDELGPEARPEELAALADGLLPPARAAQIEAQAAARPELAEQLEAQRRAVAVLRSAAAEAADDGTPSALRARIEAARRPAPRRRALLGGLAVGVAILAVLAIVLLPSGGGGPTVAAAAELATLPAPPPPPPVSTSSPALLDQQVDGVAFPAWDEEFGWDGVGQRADDLDGRTTRTVRYGKDAAQADYTIVAGDALDVPADARPVTRDGVDLRVFTQDGRTVVTWLRDGRTCVLSSRQADEDTLTKLAVWKGEGAVTF